MKRRAFIAGSSAWRNITHGTNAKKKAWKTPVPVLNRNAVGSQRHEQREYPTGRRHPVSKRAGGHRLVPKVTTARRPTGLINPAGSAALAGGTPGGRRLISNSPRLLDAGGGQVVMHLRSRFTVRVRWPPNLL